MGGRKFTLLLVVLAMFRRLDATAGATLTALFAIYANYNVKQKTELALTAARSRSHEYSARQHRRPFPGARYMEALHGRRSSNCTFPLPEVSHDGQSVRNARGRCRWQSHAEHGLPELRFPRVDNAGWVDAMSLLPIWIKLAILAAIVSALAGFYAWRVHVERDIGRDEVRAEWNKANLAQADVDLAAAASNARQTLRRLESQQENQRVQNLELAAAYRDAAADRHAADQLREQNAVVAKQWRDTLRDSPAVTDREAAADAIGVLADVLGRADRRAGVLASYADAARAAGLKCERDYDAVTAKP